MYSAYAVSEKSKKMLLDRYPATFSDLIGHHITYKFGSDKLPPKANSVRIVGKVADESLFVECFLVEIDGNMRRPDGGTFHLTWSLEKKFGAKPVFSNQAILKNTPDWFSEPIEIEVTESVFK